MAYDPENPPSIEATPLSAISEDLLDTNEVIENNVRDALPTVNREKIARRLEEHNQNEEQQKKRLFIFCKKSIMKMLLLPLVVLDNLPKM